jgi:hypothetical protein
MTLPIEGGFSPSGRGSHGLDKTSPMAASMLSFDWKNTNKIERVN